ncbi:transglutaminase domain-containing protein [Leptothermofonsia sp. ETS-13]|uniref:transglutaminase domain-containing protein n=1 Tax=Leptothermofonsia sp. ETS-13 TaxID=3035696 RepID=UPI003B9F564D
MQLEFAQPSVPGNDATSEPLPNRASRYRTVYPIGAYAIQGVAALEGDLIALDSVRGYLLRVNPATENTTIVNSRQVDEFIDACGLAIWGDMLWFAREKDVYFCNLQDLKPQLFVTMPYPVDGIGVWQSTVYVASQKEGYISIFEFNPQRLITRFPMPGVGSENLTIRGENLWVCDRTEQMVYCLDRATGELQFSVLTPYENPTGLTFLSDSKTGEDILYVSYAGEEPYIRDNPNNPEGQFELTYRDRTFIHPLYIQYYPKEHYALSNGFLVEMSYVEELLPLEEFDLQNVEWRIALPTETHRQKVLKVEPIGLPFIEEIQDGQRVAVFRFDSLHFHERHLFGWKALLEVRGIKYLLTPDDVDKVPPLSSEFRARYLVDDDELAMDTPIIQAAAKEAIGTETNLLRKILKIRNYVYDRLSYSLTSKIDTPDVVLQRGVGSCGEYVGVLLALARLNGIACRTVGRYKCPPKANQHHVPLEPDYNHVWLEFYVPGYGWLPMESNPDDVIERGPYPTRFFMGLPWYHAEIGKGIPFETIHTTNEGVDISIGELAINHVRFTILEELPP